MISAQRSSTSRWTLRQQSFHSPVLYFLCLFWATSFGWSKPVHWSISLFISRLFQLKNKMLIESHYSFVNSSRKSQAVPLGWGESPIHLGDDDTSQLTLERGCWSVKEPVRQALQVFLGGVPPIQAKKSKDV